MRQWHVVSKFAGSKGTITLNEDGSALVVWHGSNDISIPLLIWSDTDEGTPQ